MVKNFRPLREAPKNSDTNEVGTGEKS